MKDFNKKYGELLNKIDVINYRNIDNVFEVPVNDDDFMIVDEMERILKHYDIQLDTYTALRIKSDLQAYVNETLQEYMDELKAELQLALESDSVNAIVDKIENLIRRDERAKIAE